MTIRDIYNLWERHDRDSDIINILVKRPKGTVTLYRASVACIDPILMNDEVVSMRLDTTEAGPVLTIHIDGTKEV